MPSDLCRHYACEFVAKTPRPAGGRHLTALDRAEWCATRAGADSSSCRQGAGAIRPGLPARDPQGRRAACPARTRCRCPPSGPGPWRQTNAARSAAGRAAKRPSPPPPRVLPWLSGRPQPVQRFPASGVQPPRRLSARPPGARQRPVLHPFQQQADTPRKPFCREQHVSTDRPRRRQDAPLRFARGFICVKPGIAGLCRPLPAHPCRCGRWQAGDACAQPTSSQSIVCSSLCSRLRAGIQASGGDRLAQTRHGPKVE